MIGYSSPISSFSYESATQRQPSSSPGWTMGAPSGRGFHVLPSIEHTVESSHLHIFPSIRTCEGRTRSSDAVDHSYSLSPSSFMCFLFSSASRLRFWFISSCVRLAITNYRQFRKVTSYFLGLLFFFTDVVVSVFFGRPLPGTLRIFSKSSAVYKASCEKGLQLARSKRLFIVSRGSLSLSAISEIVIPFMFSIIGNFSFFLDIVPFWVHLLNNSLVDFNKRLKNVPKMEYLILT